MGIILIPQAMAYALLAGLPPIYGLYSALLPIVIYAFLGTSNYLSVGPVAITAILMFSGVSKLAEPFTDDYINLIIVLGLYVGLFQILLSIFKLGNLTKYIPKVVLSGFVQAAAIMIIISQFKNALAITIPSDVSLIGSVAYIIKNASHINTITFVFFTISLLLIIVINKKFKGIPGALVAIVIATFLTYFFQLNKDGLIIIGSIPEGLPSFVIPKLDVASLVSLIPSIVTVAFIGFIGSIGLAKSFEDRQEGIKINPNKELFTLGLSKLFGAFFQAMPSTGSFSRSAINVVSGAKTQASSLISVLLILLTLLFLTPIFYFLPNAILAAIIVHSVFSLLDINYIKRLWQFDKIDFSVFTITFLTTILLSLEAGVIVGFILYYLLIFKKKEKTTLMKHKTKNLIIVLMIVFIGCTKTEKAAILNPLATEKTTAEEKLEARNPEFKKEIIKISDNIYTAVGYDVSTINMIIGDDGYLLVDTGSNPKSAKEIKTEFDKITKLPLKGIILTHSHGDHTRGAQTYTEGKAIDIWALSNFGHEDEFNKIAGVNYSQRNLRQAGFKLPPELRINNGIAPAIYMGNPPSKKGGASIPPNKQSKSVFTSLLKPNKNFSEGFKSIKISGITVELYKAPGETDDQLFVWLPKEKALFAGDNFYKSWPNLYAIRGTEYRDVNDWVNSLSFMLTKEADYLVGGHTRPVIGNSKVKEVLTTYRDAVKYVFDKTIEGMNKGMTPDELVEYVKLPKKYADKDYLHGYYGRVDWSVRQIFNGYMGWFDGNATTLIALPKKEEATKMIALIGSKEKVINEIINAINKEEYQWAAQLSDYLLVLYPGNTDYKELKARAMVGLGRNVDNALARNYYLTVAQELRN